MQRGRREAVALAGSAGSVRCVEPQILPLICPADHAVLARPDGEESYRCSRCDRHYPLEAGVVRFLARDDPFYEGRNFNTIKWVPRADRGPWSWPLWLMPSGYVWAVRRHVPAGSTLLEIGCASGIRYFSQRYRTIGLDLSAVFSRTASRCRTHRSMP